MAKLSFPPISDNNSRILLLGTMPGETSLLLQQYYAHNGNHFWKIVFKLFDHDVPLDYNERVSLLLEKGVALWDVLEACEREGSSDNKIKDEIPNNFKAFYSKHPMITKVFFTSGKAEKLYDTYVGRSERLKYFRLPSSSGANSWKTFEEKVQEWSVILKHL